VVHSVLVLAGLFFPQFSTQALDSKFRQLVARGALGIGPLTGAPVNLPGVIRGGVSSDGSEYSLSLSDAGSHASAIIDTRSGLFRVFHLHGARVEPQGQEWDTSRELSHNQVLALVREYSEIAGFASRVSIWSLRQANNNGVKCWEAHVVPVHQGVRYWNGSAAPIHIEYQTGRLVQAHFRPYPSPPASVTPHVSAEQARATMLAYLFQTRPNELVLEELHPVELVIWRPRPMSLPLESFLTDAHRQMAENDQGLLVYRALYVNPERAHPTLGPIGTLHCYVDAKTGALLNVDDMGDPRRGGFGGGWGAKPAEMKTLFRWPQGDLSVYAGKKSQLVRGAAIESTTPGTAPGGEGFRLALFTGGRALVVRFYVKESLLGVPRGESQWQYGRPSKPLLEALRRLAPAK